MAIESTGVTFGGKEILGMYPNRHPFAYDKGANSFTCPAGAEPGHGWLVLRRSDVVALDRNAPHSLKFSGNQISSGNAPGGTSLGTMLVNNLYIANDPIRLDRAGSNPDSAYLVEITDIRYLARHFTSINKAYNVRKPHPPGVTSTDVYYTDTMDSGPAIWTWETLCEDIWDNEIAILGTWPGLPYTPAGTPEDFRFVGISAWCALFEVLQRIHCTVVLDPTSTSNTFDVVQLGQTQANLATRESRYSIRQLHTVDAQDSVATQVPETIRVFFHRHDEVYTGRADNWITPPAYTVDQATGVTGAVANTVLPIWDNTPAEYDSAGSVSNSAALDTRAEEIKDNWLSAFNVSRQRIVYKGLVKDILPGEEVRAVEWADRGGGWQTIVVKRPGMFTDLATHPKLDVRCCTVCGEDHRFAPDTFHALVTALDGRTLIKYGTLDGDLNSGSSATVSQFIDGSDSGDDETVNDAGFIPSGQKLQTGDTITYYYNTDEERLVLLTSDACPVAQ